MKIKHKLLIGFGLFSALITISVIHANAGTLIQASPPKTGGSGGGMLDPSSNGVVVRTSLNTTTARSFANSSSITWSNPDGTAGNPTASVPASGIGTSQLASSAVTYSKVQNEAATTVLCNPTSSPAAPSECTLGAHCSFTGTVLDCSGGGGGSPPSGTGVVHVTSGVQDGTALVIYVPKTGTALTDASATINPGNDQASNYLAAVSETASRTTTLGTTGTPLTGQKTCITRTSAAAFTHIIADGGPAATNPLFTFPASQTASIKFCAAWNGTDWIAGSAEYVTQ